MMYRIEAEIQAEDTHGMYVRDWFRDRELLDLTFENPDDAVAYARGEYLGPDVDGVEVRWKAVPAD